MNVLSVNNVGYIQYIEFVVFLGDFSHLFEITVECNPEHSRKSLITLVGNMTRSKITGKKLLFFKNVSRPTVVL